jgi:hypothetical protein
MYGEAAMARCQMYDEAAMEGRGCWSRGAKCMVRPLWRAEAAGAEVPKVWRGRSGGTRLLGLRCQRYGEAALEGRGCWSRGANGMARPLWRAEAAGAEVPKVWRDFHAGLLAKHS